MPGLDFHEPAGNCVRTTLSVRIIEITGLHCKSTGKSGYKYKVKLPKSRALYLEAPFTLSANSGLLAFIGARPRACYVTFHSRRYIFPHMRT
jgi:hypothetical protein